jgi:hypothetical protein
MIIDSRNVFKKEEISSKNKQNFLFLSTMFKRTLFISSLAHIKMLLICGGKAKIKFLLLGISVSLAKN